MKNIFVVIILSIVCFGGAYAACSETTTTKSYTACHSKYYKSGSSCLDCPTLTDTKGVAVGLSNARNTAGITDCYIPKCMTGGLVVKPIEGGVATAAYDLGDNTIIGGEVVKPVLPTTDTCDHYFSDNTGTYVFTENCYYSK